MSQSNTRIVVIDTKSMKAKRYVGRTHTNTAELLECDNRSALEKVIEVFRVNPRAAYAQWGDGDPQVA
jgi:hypothetical protein